MKAFLIFAVMLCWIGCTSAEKKLTRETTADLQLRHHQCADYLTREKKGFEFKFGSPMAMAMQGDPRNERIEEKERIERELLRRWKRGDREAYLPIFGEVR